LLLEYGQLSMICDGKTIAQHEVRQRKHQQSICLKHYDGLIQRAPGKSQIKRPLYDPYWIEQPEDVMVRNLAVYVQEAARHSWPYDVFLEKLCQEELGTRREKRCDLSIKSAKFPYTKTLDGFDFSYQPSLNADQIKELSKCRESSAARTSWGRKKTHLAIALGVEAIKQGYRTAFMSTQGLLASLAKANSENRLEEKLRALCTPKLLIIDEIGYLPLDRHGAHLFFHLIARRYEKGALILTSNQAYSNWGEVFGDTVLATAILDRLLHHATSINIKGESYRLKEKLKSGILNRAEMK
ncbi:MAG: IS21-like element helper ATPase IstB, partial [Alphaproteobacteria bacterium]|nr:IS21-like element helper ATPase IstB [Alphaproteobacteria bacterium]